MNVAAQRPEFVGIENLVRRIEPEHHTDPFACRKQHFGQVVERGHTYAAAHQQGTLCGIVHVEPVAEPRQQVELPARGHTAHLCGSLAHHLVDERERRGVVVADRDRTAQVTAFEGDVDELPGGGDPLRIPPEHHAPYGRRQPFVGKDFIDAFFIHAFLFQCAA